MKKLYITQKDLLTIFRKGRIIMKHPVTNKKHLFRLSEEQFKKISSENSLVVEISGKKYNLLKVM